MKRQRDGGDALVATEKRRNRKAEDQRGTAMITVPRTSTLMAPIVRLKGHEGAVNGLSFSSSGRILASCSTDKSVMLWDIANKCENSGLLRGHTNTVTEVAWSQDEEFLVTSSADKSVRWWDATTGETLVTFDEHKAFVNCCATSLNGQVVSGGDDSAARIWDPRVGRKSTALLRHPFMVTSACFLSLSGGLPPILFTGGVDGIVRAWDLRTRRELYQMGSSERCDGVVTGISCGPNGRRLVANSTDGSVVEWDARAVVKGGEDARFVRSLELSSGPLPGNRDQLLLRCAISSDGDLVAAGCATNVVPIWDTESGSLEYALPGHSAVVTDVAFHPSQPIVASGSLDRTIFVGELSDS
mmetsp:Transcript_20557/g.38243  ORF Transcript_20557/g.38243 Transcript_20557/m.38243 type:complete len:357 (-) Transcript_20557:274-1344(-)|eukprot:CAMPEP_0184527666 /NCGR_PEP_ID=MMETSP0198_2-20121128/11351_1 /TAXON_ID=1112570 /ORGANISM="Thraustochytrium sp., Strain LLF1b" /LENGTH=356 /DNA_ID=CAMNT_0026919403 /DNA_START=173 /DNA_END=1243 /DNA_ORIENTATION=-